jgi:haloalkane dehalogenase
MADLKSMMMSIKDEDIPAFTPQMEPLGPITQILRTPESAFADIKDFPFEPHYYQSKTHGNIRIHYVDEGPKDAAQTILLMHGEPTWSYLYRKMIPQFVSAGFRVVAPDLVGFGKSDKPASRADYSYERQVDWMTELFVGIDMHNITPFLQDWGGLIGLRVVARLPER